MNLNQDILSCIRSFVPQEIAYRIQAYSNKGEKIDLVATASGLEEVDAYELSTIDFSSLPATQAMHHSMIEALVRGVDALVERLRLQGEREVQLQPYRPFLLNHQDDFEVLVSNAREVKISAYEKVISCRRKGPVSESLGPEWTKSELVLLLRNLKNRKLNINIYPSGWLGREASQWVGQGDFVLLSPLQAVSRSFLHPSIYLFRENPKERENARQIKKTNHGVQWTGLVTGAGT